MHINEVKTAFKIGDVRSIPNSEKLEFVYLKNIKDENGRILPDNFLKLNLSRVYLIVVNGKIKKIGQSKDKGGIKGTLSIYRDGGVKGRPSIRSYGVYLLLKKEIEKGNKIEFFLIYHENFHYKVKGFFGLNDTGNASLDSKLIEEFCINDLLENDNGEYPDWNVQEQGMDWPEWIKIAHADLLRESTKRKSKRKKIIG